jgi:hypothetical protein
MCLQQVPALKGFFYFNFAVAINNTNKANKAGSTHNEAVYITYMSVG